ncbi:hypothetical protein Tco_0823722 [Tanacetum coccineum]|uniref:Reverse transcriptase domain-containing protein n=1 Tax=Tanacetum coccineum TaxID=301880 RepID=A0ABQ5AN44_9ASTR
MYVVDGVLAKGVDLVFVKDFATFAMKIHPFMIQIRILSMILKILLTYLHKLKQTLLSHLSNGVNSSDHPPQHYLEKSPITIAPALPTVEPEDSLIMEDKHLNTILKKESEKEIKSSVKDLNLTPSESKGIFDDICDVPFCDKDHFDAEFGLINSLLSRDISITSPKIDFLLEEFAGELALLSPILPGIHEADCDPEEDIRLDDQMFYDDTSSDEDAFEDIEYVDASPLDLEHVSLEGVNNVQIQDVILREKLLNVKRLIANIESLNDNPTPDRVLNSPSPFPIPVADSNSSFEESDTAFSHLGNSLPEFETSRDHTEETRSGRLTSVVIFDDSNEPLLELPQFESFQFDPSFPRPPPEPPDVEISLNFEPDVPVINDFDELNQEECFDQEGGEIYFSQNVEDDSSFTFVIWTFLPYLTYPGDSPLLLSTGNEDTIFDPGITTFHFTLKPVAFYSP